MARIAREMTQQELADKIHKTRPLISSIEQTGNVNIITLEKICEVLRLDVDMLRQETFEPAGIYGSGAGKLEKLEQENSSLKREIAQLEELVNNQRDVIMLLKEKTKAKPRRNS